MVPTVIGLTVGISIGAGGGYFDTPRSFTATAVSLTGALGSGRFCQLRGAPRK
jgi:hypothetical protein